MQINMNAETLTAVIVVSAIAALTYGLTSKTEVPSVEVVAVAEACSKVGKEPLITIRRDTGITMGCKP